MPFGKVLVAGLLVVKHGAPEREDVLGDVGVDRELHDLYSSGVGLDAERLGGSRDLPRELGVEIASRSSEVVVQAEPGVQFSQFLTQHCHEGVVDERTAARAFEDVEPETLGLDLELNLGGWLLLPKALELVAQPIAQQVAGTRQRPGQRSQAIRSVERAVVRHTLMADDREEPSALPRLEVVGVERRTIASPFNATCG